MCVLQGNLTSRALQSSKRPEVLFKTCVAMKFVDDDDDDDDDEVAVD